MPLHHLVRENTTERSHLFTLLSSYIALPLKLSVSSQLRYWYMHSDCPSPGFDEILSAFLTQSRQAPAQTPLRTSNPFPSLRPHTLQYRPFLTQRPIITKHRSNLTQGTGVRVVLISDRDPLDSRDARRVLVPVMLYCSAVIRTHVDQHPPHFSSNILNPSSCDVSWVSLPL